MAKTADLTRTALKHIAQYGVPSPGATGLFDVGTGRFLEYFEREVLDTLVAHGGATFRVVEGPYRAGKTHLLTLLRERAIAKEMAVVHADLSLALRLDDWKSIVKFILDNLSWRGRQGEATSVGKIAELLGTVSPSKVEALASARLPHAGFQRAMVLLASGVPLKPHAREMLHAYLRGQPIGAGALRKADKRVTGVKDPLSQRNADHALRTVLQGMHLLGIPGSLILLDETEQIFQARRSTPTRREMNAAQLMRRLIDGCITGQYAGVAFVFAVLPGFLEACSNVNAALGQRLRVSRRHELDPSWRWPVIQVADVCSARTPEDFLKGAVEVYAAAARALGSVPRNLEQRLTSEGVRVLRENAGQGYRGPLVKALAAQVINAIER